MKGVYGKYFYGNKISEYGLEYNRVDYGTLAKSFDAVLNNDIISNTQEIGYWEIVNGTDYNPDTDEYTDVYQYYIVSNQGARILQEMTDEILWYNDKLDMYVWGVTYYGTSWDYVLTDIPCNVGLDAIQE